MPKVSNEIKLKMRYDDYSTRNYTLTDIDSTALPEAKSKILAFNAELANQSSAKRTAYRDTFINHDDETNSTSPIAKIATASYVETEEEVVYGA